MGEHAGNPIELNTDGGSDQNLFYRYAGHFSGNNECNSYEYDNFLLNQKYLDKKDPRNYNGILCGLNDRINENLRKKLLKRTIMRAKSIERKEILKSRYPDVINGKYYFLCPLEGETPFFSKVFQVPSIVYKVVKFDGVFALRRVTSEIVNNLDFESYKHWYSLEHSSIIPLRDSFIFGDQLHFVYVYYPVNGSLEKYWSKHCGGEKQAVEEFLWSLMIQIISAIGYLQQKGLKAGRSIHPSKILLMGQKVKINGCGMDVMLDAEKYEQIDDLLSLGRMILSLICPEEITEMDAKMDWVFGGYSDDISNLVLLLLGLKRDGTPTKEKVTLDEVFKSISHQMTRHMEYVYNYTDILETELTRELDNGRLLRILLKLGFAGGISVRNLDYSYMVSNDIMLITCFGDYLFHQIDEERMQPVISVPHVIECLNKLEAESEEEILLKNRNSSSLLVVTYKEIKKIISNVFDVLCTRASPVDMQ